jgi:hypothetical protein
MARQRQLLIQTKTARKFAFQSVNIVWIIPVMALLEWLVILLFFRRL